MVQDKPFCQNKNNSLALICNKKTNKYYFRLKYEKMEYGITSPVITKLLIQEKKTLERKTFGKSYKRAKRRCKTTIQFRRERKKRQKMFPNS